MRSIVIKSRTIKIVLATILCAILLACGSGYASAGVYFGQTVRKVPIYNVDTQEKQIAISFDAAWGADKTQEIIDILQEYNVTATFFLVGFWVDEHEDMVKAINDAGLEIGTHSESHPDMVKLSREQMKSELESSMSKISAITGKEVSLFRAPFGSYNNALLETAESLNLKTIQWDVDSLDWKGLSAGDITSRVVNSAKSGSIILMHNNADNVTSALRMVLDNLLKKEYKITSIGELVYEKDYEVDRNGVQHKL